MDKFNPDEAMLKDYMNHDLSAEDTEKVELWLADHPEELENLELDLMFKSGMSDLNWTSLESTTDPSPSNFSQFLWPSAIAASFVIGFVLSSLLGNQFSAQMSSPHVVLVSEMRSSETEMILSNEKDILLQIPVDYLSEDLYQAEIFTNNTSQYKLMNLSPVDDLVSILIPRPLLGEGEHSMVLTNQNNQQSMNLKFSIKN